MNRNNGQVLWVRNCDSHEVAQRRADSGQQQVAKMNERTKKVLAALMVVAAAALSSACAVGKSDFSCSGPNPGTGCLPSMEVYEITNDPELQKAVQAALNEASASGEDFNHQEVVAAVRANFKRDTDEIVKPMVEPIRTPMPVLQPAQVIRIWIGPWVDTKGDLRMPGYVFSEVTPRKWSFGEPEVSGSEILAPIQVERGSNRP